MKSLKFQPHLREPILTGTKTTTWRFFDDKDIKIDDELEFYVNGEDHSFGHATVMNVLLKKVSELKLDEMKMQNYNSLEEVIQTHNIYYHNKITSSTLMKIIIFRINH